MADAAGDWKRCQEAIAEAQRRRKAWLHSLPPGIFGFGEVRHDPPWHAHLGEWKGDSDVSRNGFRQNHALCGKMLGRVHRGPLSEKDDLCEWCRVAIESLTGSRA